MQKIYVLLRQDKQTGPYSLEEIIQFDLKPYDLIWIEGKSAGWYYPQEISALHPYLGFLPKAAETKTASGNEIKKVFVAMPSTMKTVIPKAVATPKPELSISTPEPIVIPSKPITENIEEKVYAQFRKASEEKEPVVTSQAFPKERQARPSRTGAVTIATILVVGGVFAASWLLNRQPKESGPTQTNSYTEEPTQNDPATTTAITDDVEANPQPTTAKQKKALRNQQQTASNRPHIASPEQQKDARVESTDEAGEYPAATNSPQDETPGTVNEETGNSADEASAPQEKKKTLRDKFLDIFRKKPDEKNEEVKGTETENGERKATRRDGTANLTQMVHVRFDVPNEWMMGIRGAKATLVNRSNQTISKAVVEVQYYDDDNNLLEKKTITFSKVDGKESKTVTIPDHPSATKVDYSIVSAEGRPAA